MVSLLNRAIVAEIRKEFKNMDDSFLKPISSYSDKVYNDTINFTDLGSDPTVLLDNTLYPIATVGMGDTNIPVALRKMETVNTKITDDELYAIAYDKKSEARKKHMNALMRTYLKLGAFSLSPQVDTVDTPIILTSGATEGHRKKLAVIDIINLKRRVDAIETPEEGRYLTFSSNHVNDILEVDQSFRDRYYNTEKGKLITNMYGFGIFETVHSAKYNGTTNAKKAWGAVAAATDVDSSFYYSNLNNMKALGSVGVYNREASTDPENRQTVFGTRQYAIVHPVTQRGQGGIIETYVP